MMAHEVATLPWQNHGMDPAHTVAAAHEALLGQMMEAQRSLLWLSSQHNALVVQTVTAQLQVAWRDLAAARTRAAIAESRLTAMQARAAQAEALVARLKEELGSC